MGSVLVSDRRSFVLVEPASSFDSSVEDRPRRILVLARFVVLLDHDRSMLTRRVFDEDVVLVRREVVHVGTRDERVSFSSTVELFITEERGKGRVALKGGIDLVRRMRIDSSEDEVQFCLREVRKVSC